MNNALVSNLLHLTLAGGQQGACSAALATALAVLHCWGWGAAADEHLRALLSELWLLQLPATSGTAVGWQKHDPAAEEAPAAEPRAVTPQQQAAAHQVGAASTHYFVQPAVVSRGAVTLTPPHTVPQGDHEHPAAVPALLRRSPEAVAERLLALVALAQRLMAMSGASQAVVRLLGL